LQILIFSSRERVKILPFSFDNLQHVPQGVKCHATNFLEHLQWCSVCDPAKIFFASKFSYILFCNPTTHKTKTGQQIGGGLVIGNHLDRSVWYANQKQSSSQIIFITLFSAGAQHCCAFHQPPQTVQLCWAKTIFLSETGIFWLFFIQFYRVGSHIEHPGRCY
jgi:hypothetical protein